MDPQQPQYFGSINGFKFDRESLFPNSDQHPVVENGLEFNSPTLGPSFMENSVFRPDPSPGNSAQSSLEGDSPSDDSDFSDSVLKYISQVLMEEEMESKPCMFHDQLALQATEQSLYDIIGGKYPASPDQHPLYIDQNVESPDDSFLGGFSDHSSNGSSSFGNSHLVDSQWNQAEFGEYKPSVLKNPLPANFVFQSTSKSTPTSSYNFPNSLPSDVNGLRGSSVSELLGQNFLSKTESVFQFNRGVEEANKFLPKGNQLIIDLENNTFSPIINKKAPEVLVKTEIDEREHSPTRSRGRKNHEREDTDLEDERSNKQSAVYVDESDISEMFDRVLLCGGQKQLPSECNIDEGLQNGENKNMVQNGQSNVSGGVKTRAKKQGNKKDIVDLRTLLVMCAQAVSADDRRTATELLKQIRQHSSPFGDGSQRLAHCFADSLEARLAGTGAQIYSALAPKKTSAADVLKAYQFYISACPFMKLAITFANHMILGASENASTLHVIDFGILYGFQWPALIQCLSRRQGGPPKLRITGIELPQRGFRPTDRVKQTGHRLAKYCERFNIPFEFNAIAKKWETIQIEDLKINRNEVLAVNCLLRFKNLLDETVVVNNPRDAVLNLIRKANPKIFVHGIVNGSYNAPFFVTRFREALFHFSAFFDMLDTNTAREDPMRLMFEKEFFGREAMNAIACEGSERVERPETYKQWQVRKLRAGFKQLPMDREVMKKLRTKLKCGYHNDFVVDVDGHWMLQGWKGRIIFASSCWIPA
ncbi:scarecrow-like protein 33 [Fagus crenata]